MLPPLLFVLLTLFPSSSLAAQPICYWPSGAPVEASLNYLPCPRFSNSNSTTVQCCSNGEACLSNGLCYGSKIGATYRGACTDRSWNDPVCPKKYCTKDFPKGFTNLYLCPPKTPNGLSQWWCGNQTISPACEEGGGTFLGWEKANNIALPSTLNTPLPSPSTSPHPSATGSSSVTGNGTRSIANTTTLVITRTRTVYSFIQGNASIVLQTVVASAQPALTITSTSSSNSTTGSTQAPVSQNAKVATAIGAGIGVPLGVLALAGVGLLLLSRRKNDDGKKEPKGGRGGDWYRGRGVLRSAHRPQELSPNSTAPRQEMNTVQTPLDPPPHPPGFKAVVIPPTPSSPENRAPQLPKLAQSPPLMHSPSQEQSSPHPLHPSYQTQPLHEPSRRPPSIEVSPPTRSPPLPLASPPEQPMQPVLYPSHTEHPPHPFRSPELSQPSPPSPHSAGSAGSPNSVSSAYPSDPLQSPEYPPQMLHPVPLPLPYGPPPGPPPPQIYPPPQRSQLP
ncbi:MAG: hypothetical protein M1812_006822 [Candelaria pacifica]|nr:MAG: hypothetical protein M1812_006822 [Candelaria pacifica]